MKPAAILTIVTMLCLVGQVRGQATQPSTQPGGMASREHRDELIKRARERMMKDQQKYDIAQLKECENLYQVANKNWRSEEAKSTLKVMIEKYPDVNRTGCAALYLTQYERGEEQERMLKDVIERYGDCWYGNGVQVGALARFLLAGVYVQKGDRDAADALLVEIERDYPGAITHRGQLISEQIRLFRARSSTTQPAAEAPPEP